ncbi:hypothetical protein B296_00022679 [Ensete ventricosum]|uniref:Uncharacterized protein n=1 Tax=Ensete ventricosum TaxID=4639 RepID=A0A426XLS0_ENSVE|nr:hypothetical protein B296_00022679 [Ensete ventricosum]
MGIVLRLAVLRAVLVEKRWAPKWYNVLLHPTCVSTVQNGPSIVRLTAVDDTESYGSRLSPSTHPPRPHVPERFCALFGQVFLQNCLPEMRYPKKDVKFARRGMSSPSPPAYDRETHAKDKIKRERSGH